ncbi:butyrophilin subfamily 1 member A1-like isoform X4 [Acinonyx jubatus]|uniref:Butyrophilin subfamily 1 member A1-like isoform X4 n=1 Tax=Acinonyx jubatus TaxID=32536 RepID=A0ABM3Q4V3_ACIJB|nr:butyrophilin subfamily 1 member A1-like isoform X4 [Acinonyx jubatus]
MVTQQTGLDTNSLMNNETHKSCLPSLQEQPQCLQGLLEPSPLMTIKVQEFHPEADVNTYPLLRLGIIIFIIFLCKNEYCNSGELRKENGELRKENGELRKENGELRKENEKFQMEIDQRRTQFRNGWQKASLYPDWRKEFFQAVNVILDPATAHAALVLSEGNKCVTCGEESQDLPKDPQRLNSLPCVLGHSVFTSGRWYWEVDVRDSGAWDLGICRSNVMRQGKICVKPENGFWAIRSYKDEYWVLTSPEMQLTLKEHPTRVCIFLDYEGGCISFYNMMDKSHIYTFSQGPFNVSLRPFFRLWLGYSKSLTICPVPNA